MSGTFSFDLPDWVEEAVSMRPADLSEVEDRMRFVLGLASRHVSSGTGGPFAAGVFDAATHELIAVGVNLVVPSSSLQPLSQQHSFCAQRRSTKAWAQ